MTPPTESARNRESKLAQLRNMTVVVADTGDIEAIRRFAPEDATTNPSLLVKAAQMEGYGRLVEDAVRRARAQSGAQDWIEAAMDRLAVNFGVEILKIVPGRVSTEVDARLSFDVEASLAKARRFIELYEAAGVGRERVLIKLASTWEGIKTAEILEREGINCNLTLLFGFPQAVACAEAGVFLISPFVGRILDWYKAKEGRDFAPAEDPGVVSVSRIYRYYKTFDHKTVVMGASFRNTGEIEELAGCDRLTISPQLLEALDQADGPLPRKLDPSDTGGTELEPVSFDEKTFRWALCQDPMATDKLFDGIRNFHSDWLMLRNWLAKRPA